MGTFANGGNKRSQSIVGRVRATVTHRATRPMLRQAGIKRKSREAVRAVNSKEGRKKQADILRGIRKTASGRQSLRDSMKYHRRKMVLKSKRMAQYHRSKRQ